MRLNISCTACGGRLSGDEPGGLCPACLARVTFGLGPNLVGDQSSHGIHGKPQLRQFGDYELIHELGRGGMGVVYKAHQRSLDRIVAVKMILAGHFASRSDVQRFHAEAQNAARLRHPNIVSIYEVGDFEGQHFYAMEFVQGQRLADLARDQPLPSRQAARYLKALAEATHIGHLEGVIHRDLKPANILIDALDQPRITDFGLSRQLGTDSTLTLTGQAMGSPGYMAPEQASGRHEEIGPRSDVYGLGAILFHLLTARPPFHAASVPEVLRQLIEAEPLSPRLLNPAVPRDLETICLKCLTKEPQRRYASARKLAEDLDRFLCDEPVVARPASALEKSWRSCRRHPAVAGLSAAVLLLLLFVTVGSLWSAWRLKTARELAVRERDRAERTSSRLKLRTAERLLEEGDSSSAVAVLAQMLREKPADAIAGGWIMDVLGRFAYPVPLTPALNESAMIYHARFSPDGRTVATACGGVGVWDALSGKQLVPRVPFSTVNFVEFSPDGRKLACACADGTARILDATTGQELTPRMVHGEPKGAPIFSIRFDRAGARVITSTRARFARIWSAETGEPLTAPLRHGDEVDFAEFSPDGTRALTASEDHTAMIWDASTGAPLIPAMRHKAEVWMARFSPDGSHVATVSRDGTARIWDASSGQAVTEPMPHGDFVEDVEFSPDGRFIVTSSYDKTARVWDARRGLLHATPLRHSERVVSARFSPDGQTVLTASLDGTARLWNSHTGEALGRALHHARRLWYAEFSPDGQRILTASGDGSAQVWRVKPAPNPITILPHGSAALGAKFAPDGKSFATACYDGTVRIWRADGSVLLLPPFKHAKPVVRLAYSADGHWLAAVCRDQVSVWNAYTGELQMPALRIAKTGGLFAVFDPDGKHIFLGGGYSGEIWDVLTNRQINEFSFHNGVQVGLFSPDGKFVAVGLDNNTVVIHEIQTGHAVGLPFRHDANPRRLEFSADGHFLLTACGDRQARVWDLRSGRLHAPPLGHNMEVVDAQFDAAANRVVTASADGTARVWDAHTGRPITDPLSHRGMVVSACFSPAGTRVLTASVDGTARLWEAATGELIVPPLTHGGNVTAACFSPDGAMILTASRDGTVRLWSPATLPPQAIPEWFPEFAEAMAGKRVNELGAFEFLSNNALGRIQKRLESMRANDPLVRWAMPFFQK